MSNPVMRAKMRITAVTIYESGEKLDLVAVSKSGAYPEDGSDEDNTYAKYSPQASLSITIANPSLFGKFKAGQKYYVDFTQAEEKQVEQVHSS